MSSQLRTHALARAKERRRQRSWTRLPAQPPLPAVLALACMRGLTHLPPLPPRPCLHGSTSPQIYEDFAWNVAAMPVVAGRKSRIESFAGANCTYTIEAMMGDRRALQVGGVGSQLGGSGECGWRHERGRESSWGWYNVAG